MKRILIDNRTGLIVSEKKLKAGKRGRVAIAFLVTGLFSLLPDLHMEKFIGMEYSLWFDTIEHGGYYFLLTLFLFYLLPHEKRNASFLLTIFFVSVLFELMQLLIPGRTFSFIDIASNLLGISAAFFIKEIHVPKTKNA